MVHDPTSNDPDGLVDFKNPYAARNMKQFATLKAFVSVAINVPNKFS